VFVRVRVCECMCVRACVCVCVCVCCVCECVTCLPNVQVLAGSAAHWWAIFAHVLA